VQRALGGGVVGLAAIAGEAGDGVTVRCGPSALRSIGRVSGWVTLKKPFRLDVDDLMPLLRASCRETTRRRDAGC